MDLPRPALVKQVELHLSAEGRGFSYLLVDRVSGQILRLSRAAAAGYRRFAAAALGDSTAREGLGQDEAKHGFTALSWLRQMREGARFQRKPFNPMQMQLPLFEAAPLQPRLACLSRLAFGLPGIVMLAVLGLIVLMLGSRNDWKIMVEFREVFSIEALLTFGLVAPFLKLIHEFGHILAATACGVRLRKAGVNVIGLYPIPYVDCSEADLTASRRQRILISGAGILTDLCVGLLLFIAWHLVWSDELRQVLGRAFVFSVFSSLLFNANPLMRMDGYFILADLLNHRNLGTDATTALRRLWRSGLGLAATPQRFPMRHELALAGYGLASMIYRWVILLTLVWNLLPRYLGLGLLVGAWGGWLMLAAPTLNRLNTPPPANVAPQAGGRRRRMLAAGAGLLLTGALFIPVAPVAVIEVAPDALGRYAVTVKQPGFVSETVAEDGHVAAGAVLLTLSNPASEARVSLAALGVAEAGLARQIGTASGAAGLRRGEDQVIAAEAQYRLVEADRAALTLTATEAGRFTLTRRLRPGEFLPAGTVIGRLLPDTAEVVMVGAVPERLVQHFERGLSRATLRLDGSYLPLDPAALHLAEEPRQEGQPGQQDGRSFTLRLTAPVTASGLEAGAAQLRLSFEPIPVWRHGALWVADKITQFRNAEIAERQQRLENNGGQ
ncbi:hypothetical protein M3484_21740 [Pseudomonas sp. GX19020]|uniref:site-2 protease family protein n=1 Tax=Pseudomonas sp. GX19020 TaxID=2942277 RepID=UPI002018FB57|nr:site-2 protease family protein [Pseudomonas sp. GX19020]MCL4069185.1 hypothetical protein [Pseudomonas sp. GX19020]